MCLDLYSSREKAAILSVMIDSRLIWYKHYFPWCDEVIEKLDKPPCWIIDLAVEKYIPKAVSIIREYVYSEPFEAINNASLSDYYITCLLLKYLRKEISWATFLEDAGKCADGTQTTKEECEYFYLFLNDLEDNYFDSDVERKQYMEVEALYKFEIEEMNGYYIYFLDFMKKFNDQIFSS